MRLSRLIQALLCALLMSYCIQSNAQENIVTARPTLSLGSWVLPQHSFQWEQGAGYLDSSDEWLYDAFIRTSVSKSAEVRVLIPTLEEKSAVLGLKWMAIKPEGNKPGIAFALDISSGGDRDEFSVSGYRIIVDKPLTDNLTATINAGKVGDGYFGDLTLGLGIGDKAGLIGEFWYHEDWQQAQTGITYLINSETQLDIFGGLIFNSLNNGRKSKTNYTIGLGFSRRFKLNFDRDGDG